MGRMGRGVGLFQYLSKINYDRMINCERWKDQLCVILCISKRNYASEKYQDLVTWYFCFVLLPLEPELW